MKDKNGEGATFLFKGVDRKRGQVLPAERGFWGAPSNGKRKSWKEGGELMKNESSKHIIRRLASKTRDHQFLGVRSCVTKISTISKTEKEEGVDAHRGGPKESRPRPSVCRLGVEIVKKRGEQAAFLEGRIDVLRKNKLKRRQGKNTLSQMTKCQFHLFIYSLRRRLQEGGGVAKKARWGGLEIENDIEGWWGKKKRF